jgi:integrase
MPAQPMAKRSFKPLLAKAGLPDIRFHDLRRSAATLLLSRVIILRSSAKCSAMRIFRSRYVSIRT